MLSIIKRLVCKEYIYAKKHIISLYSLEEISAKFKKSDDMLTEMGMFYIDKINFEKLRFIIKLMATSDGKTPLNLNQTKTFTLELMTEAIKNYLMNSTCGVYVSESIAVIISVYGGKHHISVCPRLDFVKG